MKLVAYSLALAVGGLGLVFVAGNQGLPSRIVVGAILIAGALALVFAIRLRPRVKSTTVVQKIELSGDVSLQALTCKNCRAQLAGDAMVVRAGAAFVDCRYCGASYQLEEAPKW